MLQSSEQPPKEEPTLKQTHFLFTVALHDPALLESILGKPVVEAAWQHIITELEPKFNDLFSRYSDLTQQPLEEYHCFSLAKIDTEDSLFDLQEQSEVILTTAKQYIYEALVDYFGGGSGRKIAFVMLLKAIDDPAMTTSSNIKKWTAEEGVTSSILVEKTDGQISPYCNITRGEFVNLLSSGELQTFVQSIIDLHDEKIVGYEVLTRGPKGTEVERADKLFGSASHFGLTNEIEIACITQALSHLRSLPAPLFLTFNVGPEVLASDKLQHLLAKPDIVPYHSQIAFELTEHLPLANLEQVKTAVSRMQSAGIRIFLDDTGCGFFDISTAEALKPSVVKLCISVIRRIDGSEEIRQEVCDTRMRLDQLGAITLGEGVEEDFQAQFLKEVGVRFAQGYFFDKPAPIKDVIG